MYFILVDLWQPWKTSKFVNSRKVKNKPAWLLGFSSAILAKSFIVRCSGRPRSQSVQVAMSFSPFSTPPIWQGGPNFAGYHDFPNAGPQTTSGAAAAYAKPARPRAVSQYPITTGTSVFGIKYKDGVVLAADTLGSYGSLARFPDVERVYKVNDSTVVACTGDYADFQLLKEILEQKQIFADIRGGGANTKPEAVHCWLTRLLYNRRSRFDPLWTTVLVAGMQGDEPFMGLVDYIGTAHKEESVATGMGADIGVPILR